MQKTLTDMQQQALNFMRENEPAGTLRQISSAAGFPSHQAFIGAVAALYMKGYLVVAPDQIPPGKQEASP